MPGTRSADLHGPALGNGSRRDPPHLRQPYRRAGWYRAVLSCQRAGSATFLPAGGPLVTGSGDERLTAFRVIFAQ